VQVPAENSLLHGLSVETIANANRVSDLVRWPTYVHTTYYCYIFFIFLPLVLRSQGTLKLTKQYKGGYDRQSVLSAAGKLSCNKTALKRCTKTEIIIIIITIGIIMWVFLCHDDK